MEDMYSRTSLILGDKIDCIKSARVLIFGVGGVGGYTLEALARAGVGVIGIVDNDVFATSNLNRQILATQDAIGRRKCDVAKERVLSINPLCDVRVYDMFYSSETASQIALEEYDYVVDAIDTVTSKLLLIQSAKSKNLPIISCMGTGNKVGTNFEVADIKSTSVCPLAKVMRKELKARGIDNLKVVYSKEIPLTTKDNQEVNGRHIPGSISYAPAVAGMVLAGEVIRDLIGM